MIDPLQGIIPFPPVSPFLWGGYAANRLYCGLQSGGPGSAAFAANTVLFFPYQVFQSHTFTAAAIQVTATGGANNARIALYNSLNGIPSSLIVDAGLVSGGSPLQTTGLKLAFMTQALNPGLYWAAVVLDGTCTLEAQGPTASGTYFATGSGTDLVAPDAALTAAMAFNAFPQTAFTAPMGALAYLSQFLPIVALRA